MSSRSPRCLLLPVATAGALLIGPFGCQGGLDDVDRRVQALLDHTSAALGDADEAYTARAAAPPRTRTGPAELAGDRLTTAETIPTLNPSANALRFETTPDEGLEATAVIERLERYTADPDDARHLDLAGALEYSIIHGRDYRFAEEEYVLDALQLLIEEHRWGPRFFNDVSATITGFGDDGTFDTAVRLVNEFRVTQRLPYGGEVSARALADATEDLHLKVAGEKVQTADLIFDAQIPLLRGAGTVAREDLIQARRNMVYAARIFERFRRAYLVDVCEAFLDLVVRQRSIGNAERQVESLVQLEEREVRLYEEGRQPQFESALAVNATIRARDSLNGQYEDYLLAVDRFKLLIGMPIEEAIIIDGSSLGLPMPQVSMESAVMSALLYRLDLQNQRDFVDDSVRRLENARNDLLPDLDFAASIDVPTNDERARAGLDFDPKDLTFEAGVTYSLPLDREIERLGVRSAQIRAERERRDYIELRDAIATEARRSVRAIDSALFSLRIQEQGIEIAERRQESLEADPAAATARDFSEAANDLVDARDARDRAQRDLEVAILRYLLNTGQLRVNPQGLIKPLDGMTLPADSGRAGS